MFIFDKIFQVKNLQNKLVNSNWNSKLKTGNRKGSNRNQRKRKRKASRKKRGTGRWIKAHQLVPARQPNLPLRIVIVFLLPASSSVARPKPPDRPPPPPDGSDECRRPPRSIKKVPPLWISSRSCSSSLSPSFLTDTETLAPAEPLAVARDHPQHRRVAPELHSEFLLLLVKSNGLGSSQSTPASSASR
jgi:hypothetical protein